MWDWPVESSVIRGMSEDWRLFLCYEIGDFRRQGTLLEVQQVVLAYAALLEYGTVTKFCRGCNMPFCVTVSYQPKCGTVSP